MPDYVAPVYVPGEGCQCCYGPDGCTLDFVYYATGGGQNCTSGFTLRLEGPEPCIGTYDIMTIPPSGLTVPYTPPDPPPEDPPPCNTSFNCATMASQNPTQEESVTFGPTELPIACCECKIKLCIADFIALGITYLGDCDTTGLPTSAHALGDYRIDIRKGGVTLKTFDLFYTNEFLVDEFYLYDTDEFVFARCHDIDLKDFCNMSP